MDTQQSPHQPQPPPNLLPYQQIIFIHTQTIGLQKQPTLTHNTQHGQIPQQKLSKQYKYRDILIPISVRDVSRLYLYYLFHVGPVYNWLRDMRVFGHGGSQGADVVKSKGCYQRQVLQQYIMNRLQTINSNNNKTNSYKNTKQQQFYLQNLKQLLIQYAKKWQIVKKCIQCKIHITKPSSTNPSSSPSSICRHLLKSQTYTQHYSYNNKTQQLWIQKYYCKQCSRYIRSCNNYQIKEYPLAPIFGQYYGQAMVVKLDANKDKSIRYRLNQVYSNKYVMIKSANGLWYKCDINTGANNNINNSKNNINKNVNEVGQMIICNNVNTILGSASKITNNNNNTGLYVYIREQITTNCGILKQAISLSSTTTQIKYTNQKGNTNTANVNAIDDIFNTKYSKQKINNNKISNKDQYKNNNKQSIKSNFGLNTNASAVSSFSKRILKQSQAHIQHPKQYQQNIFKHDLGINKQNQQKTNNRKSSLAMNQDKDSQIPRKQKKKQITNQQKDDEDELQDMKDQAYNPYNQIIIDSKLGQVGSKYKEEVEKLYLKPKEKDQYERDYDKGKTKKIKKKHDYIKPNYNELFKQVKKEHAETAKIAEQAEKEGLTFRQKQKAIQKQKERANKQFQGNFKSQSGKQRDRGKFRKFVGRQSHKKWKKKKKEIFVQKFQQS